MHLRLRPIRVFCFHQVSEVFDPLTMWKCDWTQIVVFKKKILELQAKYTFISLQEAYNHIVNDHIRLNNYAVLTADDGWASLKEIIPWLAEQRIPVTLFLNPLYLDGQHFQERETEKLLTHDEVTWLVKKYDPLITIASHGWKHNKCDGMENEEFVVNVRRAEAALGDIPGKVPFYAFTYGRYTKDQLGLLNSQGLVPVLMDGDNNCYNSSCVHRESLDGKK